MIVYNDMEPSEKVKIYDKGITVKNLEQKYKMLVSYRSGDMLAPNIPPTEALSLEVENFINQLRALMHMENDREIIIYTDGACLGNPGAGGWGAIIIINKREEIISGGSKETTNNRMEMFAVIEALKKASNEAVINLYTDI